MAHINSKHIFSVIAGLLIVAAICYMAQTKTDKVKSAGENFVIGYEQYAPYISETDGHPCGLDYELAQEIARRNGWKLSAKLIEWKTSESFLDTGKVDCLVSGVRLTPQRRAQQECTAPYLTSAEVIVATRASGIKKMEDLAGKRIAVQNTDPVYEALTKGEYRRIGEKSTLICEADFPKLKHIMESGKADALITDNHVANANFGNNPKFVILRDNLYDTRIVMAIRKGNLKLRDQIQCTLQNMHDDGTLAQLAAKWCGDKAAIPSLERAASNHKKILVLHSGNVYFVRSKQLFDGFSRQLADNGRIIDFDIAGLNVFFRDGHLPQKNDLSEVQKRIDAGNFDMIVTNNNPATDLFLQGKLQSPQDVPLLCMSYHGRLEEEKLKTLNMTGIETPSTESDNIELALRLLPDPDKILYVSEASADGTAQAKTALTHFPENLKNRLIAVSGWTHSSEELIDICAGLSTNSVVIVSSWASVKDTASDDVYSILPKLRAATKALILGKYDSYLPLGADGGVMCFNVAQGEQAAFIAERIFQGERASEIPITQAINSAQIKYESIERLRIPLKQIPASVSVTNIPLSWAARWQNELLAVISILGVCFVFITILFFAKRRNYKRVFHLLQERDITLNSIGDGAIVTDIEGKIVTMNPVAESLTGWTLTDALGRNHSEIFQIVDYLNNQPVPSPIDKALATKTIIVLANHTDLISRNGKRYHIADSAAPICALDGKVSGAILIFRDVTGEYNQRDRLRSYARQMEIASDMASLASFHGNPETLDCEGSKQFSELWPMRSGRVVPSEEWICKEDYPEFRKKMNDLYSGKITKAVFAFKTDYFGTTRHYRAAAILSKNSEGKQLIDGAVQDVTQIVQDAQTRETESELWKLAIESLPLIFFAKDVENDYRYVLANQFFCDLVKTPREKILGHTDFEFPSNAEKYRREDIEIVASGIPRQSEDLFESENGEHRYLHTLKLPFFGADGRKLLLGISSDVTTQQMLQKDDAVLRSSLETILRESNPEEAAGKVLGNVCAHIGAPHGYIFKFNSQNQKCISIVEYSGKNELMFPRGQEYSYVSRPTFEERLQTTSLLLFPDLSSDILADPGISPWAEAIRKFSLRSLYVHRIMYGGKPWGFVALAYDNEKKLKSEPELQFFHAVAQCLELLLERKRTDERLLTALHEAQNANKAKDFFISSVSHELRTPLNTVMGFTDLLRRDDASELERKDFLNAINHSANALLRFISDMLELSQAESGAIQLSPECVNFNDLGTDMLATFAHRAAEKNIELHLEVEQIPELMLDKLRVRQILFNLLGNAVRFTRKGSVTLSASFSPSETGTSGTLTFSVRDTGIGMDENDRKMLMEPFAKLTNYRGTNATNEGTGLGTALSRKLVLCMHGAIELQSVQGEGSVFTITLPDVEIATDSLITGKKDVHHPDDNKTNLPVFSVLLVDDVPMNLKVLKAICTRVGITDVVAVESGLIALEELRKKPFGLVLTDLWMPEMTGADLVSAIRRDEALKHLPVVAITADVGANKNFDMSEFSGIILKPATFAKVEKVIKMVQHNNFNSETGMKINELVADILV